QDKNDDFYRSFNLIVCGLDSIVARRWLNGMIVGLLNYDDEGNLNPGTIIPIIDGGTEGFKGNARVILPGYSPCIECTINLYPPQVNFPLCTIAHTPRLPEHCVEYVKVIQWEKDAPFKGAALDGDDPSHVEWVFDEATKRAEQYSINGVTYRLTQGVLKRIIPAVASTNAVIAAACAFEAFKLASNIALPLNNYVNFSDVEGIFMGAVSMEKRVNYLNRLSRLK
uniref:NEDD8-activating enzyme E1 catalytic subunit n=1 Tax=Plectus sambesii TaxID=2011161 RepID=A0A914UYT7_9BILA